MPSYRRARVMRLASYIALVDAEPRAADPPAGALSGGPNDGRPLLSRPDGQAGPSIVATGFLLSSPWRRQTDARLTGVGSGDLSLPSRASLRKGPCALGVAVRCGEPTCLPPCRVAGVGLPCDPSAPQGRAPRPACARSTSASRGRDRRAWLPSRPRSRFQARRRGER